MTPDIDSLCGPLVMRMPLINRTTLFRLVADELLKVALKRYKSDHENKVRFETIYAPGVYFLVSWPPLVTSATKRPATRRYSKLITKRHGPYHVLSVRSEYLNILQERVVNSVSINRVVQATQKGGTSDESI